MKQVAVAFVAGVVFAMGLGLSGMTNPEKILGFLDVAGRWDPSLLLVMGGAVAVHFGFAQWALRARQPLLERAFERPSRAQVDGSLVVGSILFGVGWGAIGYCPGPAIVDLVAPSPSLLVFMVAMVSGVAAYRYGRWGSVVAHAEPAADGAH